MLISAVLSLTKCSLSQSPLFSTHEQHASASVSSAALEISLSSHDEACSSGSSLSILLLIQKDIESNVALACVMCKERDYGSHQTWRCREVPTRQVMPGSCDVTQEGGRRWRRLQWRIKMHGAATQVLVARDALKRECVEARVSCACADNFSPRSCIRRPPCRVRPWLFRAPS